MFLYYEPCMLGKQYFPAGVFRQCSYTSWCFAPCIAFSSNNHDLLWMPKNNIKKLSQQQNKNKINCSRRCLEVFWNGTIVLQWRQSVIHIFTSECLCIKTTANVNFFHKWWSITLPSFSLVFPSRPCSDQAHFGILTACCPRWQKEYHQIQDLYPLLAGYLSKRFNELF